MHESTKWTSARRTDDRLLARGREAPQAEVPEEGVEGSEASDVDGASRGYSPSPLASTADGARSGADPAPIGPAIGPASDLDAALSRALEAGVAAGDLELVARIVEELRARRLAAAGPSVVALAERGTQRRR